MTGAQDFHINDADFLVCKLQSEHTRPLQRLFEQCADYVMIVDGESVSPTAGQETFEAAPLGVSPDDKFLYGLFSQAGNLVGVLEGVRHYPDEATWWIGLLMLSPDVRSRGLGRKLVEGEVHRTEGAEKEGIIEAGWYTRDQLVGEVVYPPPLMQHDWEQLRAETWQVECLPSRKTSF